MTDKLRKRFIKDYGLPINVYKEPYFSYYIERLQPYYNSKNKYDAFLKLVDKYGDGFVDISFSYTERIIKHIQEKDEYKQLQQDKLKDFNRIYEIPEVNLYTMDNDGKKFISIDIKQANFNALRYYNEKLVDEYENFDEFLLEFIDREEFYEYFTKSKYIRQVIFGNLVPKKQRKIQKYMIDVIIKNLLENNVISEDDIYSTNNDELILFDKGQDINTDLIKFSNIIRIKRFELNSIKQRKFFVKKYENGEIEFKAIPSNVFFQVLSLYEDKEFDERDLMFMFENKIAKFIETI